MSDDLIKAFKEAPDDALLDRITTAAGLGVKVSLLSTKAIRGGGPPFQKIGFKTMYKKSDAVEWLKAYKHNCRKVNPMHYWRVGPAC
jgi:hypothetical protein